MEELFIGIDGGGTKLRLCVDNADGVTLFEAVGGPANIRTSKENAWQAILSVLQQGFHDFGMTFPLQNVRYHASFGLAGAEHVPSLQAFLNYRHPFATLTVTSDAKIACLGAHGKQSGAIIIVGTGIIGYQQEGEHFARVSGWGFPHDDIGSGAHLGMQAVLATFKTFDGRLPCSPLTISLQQKWPTPEALLAYFHEASPHMFASVVPRVFEAALQKDRLALQLIEHTCDAIYDISNTLFQKQLYSEEALPLVLLGGLANPLMPYLNKSFKKRLREPLMSPEKGAILLVK